MFTLPKIPKMSQPCFLFMFVAPEMLGDWKLEITTCKIPPSRLSGAQHGLSKRSQSVYGCSERLPLKDEVQTLRKLSQRGIVGMMGPTFRQLDTQCAV